jgi:hypothetical protein
MTTALDLIKGGLRRCNAYQSGETIAPEDAQDCLDTLNDLLDSLSIDHAMNYGTQEWILSWIPGKSKYTVGNPTNAELSGANNTATAFHTVWPNIAGTLTGGSNVITGVTSIPSNLVAGAAAVNAVGCGSTLGSFQNKLPPNVTVTAFNAGAQTITMSANATGSSVGQDSISYTVPGDFPIDRPVRVTGGYTRFSNLDFTLDVYTTQDQYNGILFKAQPGPWPIAAWYSTQYPYGLLNVYQTPGNGAELHLFTDTVLANLTLNQSIVLPQGYSRALKWMLAKEFCAEFGFPLSDTIKVNYTEAMESIKALNSQPAEVANYDSALVGKGGYDAGWIMHGGYGRR